MNLKYMDLAIKEAKKAFLENEVPVGCVIVRDNEILAIAHNQKENMCCVTKHAEILAVEKASLKIGNWRLENCDVYVTLEPCPMCASALKQARVKHIYCGLSNSDSNNLKIINEIFEKDKNNNEVLFTNNLAVEKVKLIMRKFFEFRRNT